ncbi:DUF4214 domain-containing protein [Oxalobacteraceae bacterium OTU3CAMAD1]|nr:DUF4214 domain-containing protein [Oxalobacteraceae bacterium OTU3CAMAD1]
MKIPSKVACLCVVGAALSACGGSDTETTGQKAALLSSGATVVSPQAAQQAASVYTPLLQQIYLGFYGRPADPAGLAFWGQQFSNANMPLTLLGLASSYATNDGVKQMVDAFALSVEAQDVTSGTSAAFVNAVYLNAFNRIAESTGNDYWSALVDGGKFTRAQIALVILNGAQGSDAMMITKKTQGATAVTAALDTPAESAAYAGDSILQGARDLLSAITATTDMAAYQAQIDEYVASIQGPGAYPTIVRYSGFSTAQRPTGTPSYSARFSYSAGGVAPPATAGSLIYGLGQTTVGWTRGAANQIQYASTFITSSTIQGGGLMPAVTMLCRPATGTTSVPDATDVLVARAARQLGAASELAGQTLATYREDCAINSVRQSISFDSAGNATFTSAAGVSKIDAATVNAGLKGQMLHDSANNLDFYFFAYSYVRANGATGYALVQRMSVPATTGGTSVPAASILPGESVAVWSQE